MGTARLLLVVAAAALFAAASAQAEPAWLAPKAAPISGGGKPSIGLDQQGNLVLAVQEWATSSSRSTIRSTTRTAADGNWSAPVVVGLAGQVAYHDLAVSPSGYALATWIDDSGGGRVVRGAVRDAAGAWGPAEPIGAAGGDVPAPTHAAIDDDGNAIAVWQRNVGDTYQVFAAIRPASSGVWQTPLALSNVSSRHCAPRIEVNAHGDAIVVWRDQERGNFVVRSATADTADAAWGSIATISGENVGWPRLAVDRDGNAIAVWSRGTVFGLDVVVQTAEWSAATGAWSAPVNASDPADEADAPNVAVDHNGNVAAVWRTNHGAWTVAVADRPSGGGWTGPLDVSAGNVSLSELGLAFDANGNAFGSWQGYDGDGYYSEIIGRSAAGGWGDAMALSLSGAEPTIAFDRLGGGVAMWHEVTDAPSAELLYSSYVPVAPPATLEVPTSAGVNQAVRFRVPTAPAYWDFGDEASGDENFGFGSSVSHTYAAAGVYTVVVVTQNPFGEPTTRSRTITISASSTGSTSPPHTPRAPRAAPSRSTPSSHTPAATRRSASPLFKPTSVKLSSQRWRGSPKLPRHIMGARLRSSSRTPSRGMTISFDAVRPGVVSLSFARLIAGRSAGGRCVRATPANRHKPSCARPVGAGRLRYVVVPGRNAVEFYGRLSPRRRLAAGKYRLTIRGEDATNQAGVQKLFTILG